MSNPLLRAFCSKCGKNGMECECSTFHPNIIVDEGEVIDQKFVERRLLERSMGVLLLSVEDCKAIMYYFEHEYISHEFHPRIHTILSKMHRFLLENRAENRDENSTKNKGTKG